MNYDDLILVESAPLRFLLSLPEGEPTLLRPVLCFLHGYDEGAPTEIHVGVTRHGPLRQEASTRVRGEFILVAPQLPMKGDVWRSYGDAVLQIVSRVQAEHRGDPKKTYLTGFSFGGNGVFDLALRDQDAWAALWAVDPTRVPEADPGLPVWLSSGEACRPRLPGFIERLRLQAAKTGWEERVFVDEGLDHVETATSAYRNNRIYDWLLSKSA